MFCFLAKQPANIFGMLYIETNVSNASPAWIGQPANIDWERR
jgi:hypothetical protein